MNDQNFNENITKENLPIDDSLIDNKPEDTDPEAVTEPIPEAKTDSNPTPTPTFVPESEPAPAEYPSPTPTPAEERVYIGVAEKKPVPEKRPKARLSFTASVLLIIICVIFAGGAAFAGTVLGNILINNNVTVHTGPAYQSSASPSVVFKTFENPNAEIGTYEQVAEAVSPTVVEIITESLVTDSYFWGSYVTSGAGSGVIISEDGMIITNNHVVSGARNVKVRLSDGTEYEAEVIGTDSDTDIAVIKIEAENLPFALLGNSDDIRVGEEVLAVGNPLGELGGTVTNGIVSALSRNVTIDGTEMTLIQMNAAVNPGNSGGGLFNLYGELVGIVNAKTTSSSSGISVEGIGFAIPINTASKVADELVNHGYVRGKAILGINYVDITSSYEAMMYRVSALGIYVTASEQPNLQVGDRIVAINGEDVTYSTDVKAALTGMSVGDVISVTVVRSGRHVVEEITLIEYVPATATPDTEEKSSAFENNFRW